MKFESKYGIGEICFYRLDETSPRESMSCTDQLVKILAITFEQDLTIYTVEISATYGIQRFTAKEQDLTGDPDFDQETGYINNE